MATVNKNFVIKNGLVVQGSTATVNGNTILTESNGDSYILNLVGGATLVKSVDSVFTVDNSGNLTLNYHTGLTKSNGKLIIDRTAVDTWYDAAGSASTAQTNAENYADGLISTLSGQTSTDIQNAISTAESYADGLISQEILDRNSAISTALSTAETYADGVAQTAENAAKSYADSLATNYDPAGAASTAQSNANTYTDGKISQEVTDRNSAISSAISTEVSNRNTAISNAISTEVTNRDNAIATALSTAESYTDTAVANLVDGAPQLLDTLNELAAAIADNPNYATDVANLVATKADTTYVDTQDAATLSSANSYTDSSISTEVTNRNSAISTALSTAENYADTVSANAENAAKSYADSLAVNYDPAGAAATAQSNANSYTDNAVNSIQSANAQISGTQITPESVLVNNVANQYATTITGILVADGASTVMGISANLYRTVKALVKAKNGNHTQVSEILVTLDALNNVAITEYAMVGTNGSLGDVSAIYHQSGNIFITFTPAYNNTDVMCYATALI